MRPRIGSTVVLSLVALAFSVSPVAAVPGWSGPNRVVPDNYPLSPSAVLWQGVYHAAYLHEMPVSGTEPNGIFYAATQANGTWEAERVTTGDDFYARPSLAIDVDGHAHIAFARVCFCEPFESNIWTASNATGEWVVDQLTDGAEDLAPSLVWDADHLEVAFNRIGRGVIYGSNESGGWLIQRAVSLSDRCATLTIFPSLANDGAGKPWIAYEHPRHPATGCSPSTKGIRVLTKTGTTWSSVTISNDTDDVMPKLDVDAANRPHLAFERAGTGIYYTRRAPSGNWSPMVLASSGNDATLAVDASGKAHVASETSGVEHSTNRSGTWVHTPLTSYSIDFGTASPPVVLVTNTGKARVLFARSESDGSEDSLGIYLARES